MQSAKQSMQDALGMLAAAVGIYYPNADTEELTEEEAKVTLERLKSAVDQKLRYRTLTYIHISRSF